MVRVWKSPTVIRDSGGAGSVYWSSGNSLESIQPLHVAHSGGGRHNYRPSTPTLSPLTPTPVIINSRSQFPCRPFITLILQRH
ncbi:hypothetical protein J6590_070282 [Homalodisca vitripennis]|nr:hypothetical protein J6590_094140 [Homalodisca vitripennis]KAG8295880.1 hypothetical protein J6590_070282 [Homalodisca vitripennis]